MMNDITSLFSDTLTPYKALLIYKSEDDGVYVESYDMDDLGRPINAHPLTVNESATLCTLLEKDESLQTDYLRSKGILPENVLYIDNQKQGSVLWYTPEMQTELLFIKDLTIPSGKAGVPALLWWATKDRLSIFAIQEDKRPDLNTLLYYAPFFNIHENGSVCMGTVNTALEGQFLEDFIERWQAYFFNSYFSHLIGGHPPVKSNIVQLWSSLIGTDKKFPVDQLNPSKVKIKDLIK